MAYGALQQQCYRSSHLILKQWRGSVRPTLGNHTYNRFSRSLPVLDTSARVFFDPVVVSCFLPLFGPLCVFFFLLLLLGTVLTALCDMHQDEAPAGMGCQPG